jgi:hypothetical protein
MNIGFYLLIFQFTDQIGFIPGCLVSACVQLYSYAAAVAPREREAGTP